MAKLTNTIKNQIISEYLKTASGRAKIAAAMSSPLRKRRDYQAVGRKAFLVEDIMDGVYAIYDRDPEVEAYVIGEEGENIIRVTRPERVFVPTYEIAANPEIPLSQARQRRYDLVNRALTLGKVAINEQEDLRVIGVFNASAAATNPLIPATAPITPSIMSDAFAGVETSVVGTGLGGGTIGDNTVTKVFWNGRDYTDIRKFGRDIYDPETQALVLKTGVKGYIWGAQMIIARLIPAGKVYFLGEPDLTGRFPVRAELTVLAADDPKLRTVGFSIFEEIGTALTNSASIQRVDVTRG